MGHNSVVLDHPKSIGISRVVNRTSDMGRHKYITQLKKMASVT